MVGRYSSTLETSYGDEKRNQGISLRKTRSTNIIIIIGRVKLTSMEIFPNAFEISVKDIKILINLWSN